MAAFPIKSLLGQSVLFTLSPLEPPDSVEHRLYYCYGLLERAWFGKVDDQLTMAVFQQASKGPEAYVETILGLLYGMLVFPNQRQTLFILTQSVVQDGWSSMVEQLKYFTFSRFLRLRPECRDSLFWLLDRLLHLNVRGCDGLLLGLFRQVIPGCRSPANITVILSILKALHEHQLWLQDQTVAIPYVAYFLLRLLADISLPRQSQELATELAQLLLRQRYHECSSLGRELVRCFLDVARVPAFKDLWIFLTKPEGPSNVPPIVRLLLTPTPKKCLAMRLTPEMESNVRFLLEHVPMERQSFYFSLFAETHITREYGDDGGLIIVDLIRYLVVSLHPSNAVLGSQVVQRWSFILFLLKTLKTSYRAVGAKLALLFDWLLFDPQADSIMCLEPGLLVMVRSVVTSPKVTWTLMEFLALMQQHFYPPLSEHISRCIDQAMLVCVQKQVVPSINGLTLSPNIPEDVKTMIHSLFGSALSPKGT